MTIWFIIIFLFVLAYQLRPRNQNTAYRPLNHSGRLPDETRSDKQASWRQIIDIPDSDSVVDIRADDLSPDRDVSVSVVERREDTDYERVRYDAILDEDPLALVLATVNEQESQIRTRMAGHTAQVVIFADADGLTLNNVEPDGSYESVFNLSASDFEALPDHTGFNQLIQLSSDGLCGLYKTTDGEYQVSIGPGADGTVRTFNFTGLPPQGLRASEFMLEP